MNLINKILKLTNNKYYILFTTILAIIAILNYRG